MRTFIFLTFLLVSSFAIERKADNINQIIDELVELHKVIKSPKAHVAGLLGNVQKSRHDAGTAFRAFFTTVQGSCKAGAANLGGFIKALQGDVVEAQTQINNFKGELASATKNSAKYAAQVKTARAEIENANKRFNQALAAHQQHRLEAEEKLRIIRHVRNIVHDELLNAPPAKPKASPRGKRSLLQVHAEAINGKLQELKGLVEKSDDSLYSTVVASLIEMASEQNLNDQTILRKFLAALRKLRNNFRKFIVTSAKEFKATTLLHKKNMKSRLSSLRALSSLLAQTRSDVKGATVALHELDNVTNSLNQTISRKNAELKNLQKLCDDQARIAKLFQGAFKNLKGKVIEALKLVVNLK
jgi:acyl CoA:acetate/3-ketoacid CoA transferase alpha subunit